MARYLPSSSPVFRQLFSPVTEVYDDSQRQYDCQTITDLDFLEMGVLRCLSESTTGRDFIQRHGDHDRLEVKVDHFFKALKSSRRIENLASVNSLIAPLLKERIADPYASIAELNGFAIYAGDGHYHKGAAHDAKRTSKNGTERKPSTGHFFMINLRTHYMSHLGTADVSGERKAEHDMRAIKKSAIEKLRGGELKGTRVILVWDKAGIDFNFWNKAKMNHGLYFISREKENMKLIGCGNRTWDADDKRNAGVLADEQVGPGSGGAMLRRITYRDPETQTLFKFITTEMTLPPGVICLLYKQRWDIEKVYDEFKNKMDETKSWGSGDASKTSHALFLCLAHNLMVLLESLISGHGVGNAKEIERKETRLRKARENGANFVATFLQRCTVRSLKFIRWLRAFVYREVHWERAVDRLRVVYAQI